MLKMIKVQQNFELDINVFHFYRLGFKEKHFSVPIQTIRSMFKPDQSNFLQKVIHKGFHGNFQSKIPKLKCSVLSLKPELSTVFFFFLQ